MRQALMAYVAETDNRWFVDSLEAAQYPNALRHAAAMIGNSSSGIIEAPMFDLPVINVGDRQKGRARDFNVKDVGIEPYVLVQTLNRILSDYKSNPVGRDLRDCSVYGDGRAGPRIADVLLRDFGDHNLLLKQLDLQAG